MMKNPMTPSLTAQELKFIIHHKKNLLVKVLCLSEKAKLSLHETQMSISMHTQTLPDPLT